jgi:small subunit ribosomal protein S4
VNGQVVNIPSFQLRPGDKIAVRERSKSLATITLALAGRKKFDWLDWNESDKQGVFLNYPERVQIPENIKEQLIVELYSK